MDSGNFKTVLKESTTLSTILGPIVNPREKLRWTSHPPEEEFDTSSVINSRILRDKLFTVIKSSLNIPVEETHPTHLGCKGVVQLDYFVKVKPKYSLSINTG